MNKYFTGTLLFAIAGLAGCASTAETDAYRKSRATPAAGQETLVGSRLVKPTTERIVKAVGNNEYNQENQHRGIANEVGAKAN
ncbi:MAG: hypothetical protein ABI790_09005 [Betaproteobacteria bacterium]